MPGSLVGARNTKVNNKALPSRRSLTGYSRERVYKKGQLNVPKLAESPVWAGAVMRQWILPGWRLDKTS